MSLGGFSAGIIGAAMDSIASALILTQAGGWPTVLAVNARLAMVLYAAHWLVRIPLSHSGGRKPSPSSARSWAIRYSPHLIVLGAFPVLWMFMAVAGGTRDGCLDRSLVFFNLHLLPRRITVEYIQGLISTAIAPTLPSLAATIAPSETNYDPVAEVESMAVIWLLAAVVLPVSWICISNLTVWFGSLAPPGKSEGPPPVQHPLHSHAWMFTMGYYVLAEIWAVSWRIVAVFLMPPGGELHYRPAESDIQAHPVSDVDAAYPMPWDTFYRFLPECVTPPAPGEADPFASAMGSVSDFAHSFAGGKFAAEPPEPPVWYMLVWHVIQVMFVPSCFVAYAFILVRRWNRAVVAISPGPKRDSNRADNQRPAPGGDGKSSIKNEQTGKGAEKTNIKNKKKVKKN